MCAGSLLHPTPHISLNAACRLQLIEISSNQLTVRSKYNTAETDGTDSALSPQPTLHQAEEEDDDENEEETTTSVSGGFQII